LTFASTPLPLARALAERGYDEPTPVQAAVLAADAADRDLIVSAQTGSGKTIAYGLALADTLLRGADKLPPEGPLALVIAPTRELALQVQRELAWLYAETGAAIVACVGGMDPRAERRALERGAHIVVGTPGRLRDHVERRALTMATLRAVVLDEADEMLDLGFREDLEFILEATPAERRTLLFSATLPKAIVALATRYQRDALRIETGGKERGHADIDYRVVRVKANERVLAIVNILRATDSPSAIIFCNTRDSVRHLSAMLQERGFAAVTLSGELSQNERNHALQALRDHRAKVCVATDVAARGLDLPNLGLVIHADLPTDPQVLQHRSGRTGRAGRKGVSILLVPPASGRRADRLLEMARLTATFSGPPTADEIRELDQRRLLTDPMLADAPSEEDLAMGRRLIEGASAETIAAALVRLYRSRLPEPEDVSDPGVEERRPERARREPREPGGYDRNAATGNGGIWFRIDVGRKKNADPKWLLPMLCKRGGITKRDIGTIRIFDRESKVEIAPRAAEAFAAAVAMPGPAGDNIAIERSSAPGGIDAEGPRPRAKPGYKPKPKGAGHRRAEHG
jgi:ATP-dependent RNA helicase DeaD